MSTPHQRGDLLPLNCMAYTVAQTAELLQVTERTVRQLIRTGKLVARQCGTERGIRIGRNAIEAFLMEPDEALIAPA